MKRDKFYNKKFNPNKPEYLGVVFTREKGGFNLTPPNPLPLHISRRTYLISIQLYTIVKQSI